MYLFIHIQSYWLYITTLHNSCMCFLASIGCTVTVVYGGLEHTFDVVFDLLLFKFLNGCRSWSAMEYSVSKECCFPLAKEINFLLPQGERVVVVPASQQQNLFASFPEDLYTGTAWPVFLTS